MLRESRMAWDKRGDASFTWRGGEVSRLEGFSDAVFGFALTLLVVSLEVPRSFAQLAHAMHGMLGFAFCFVMLLGVWEKHYRFFRRFGLQDGPTLILNGVLLFVVVFYVYPLKFLSSVLFDGLFEDQPTTAIAAGDGGPLLAIYGGGFAAIFLLFALLYGYAWRRRAALDLSPLEAALTRSEIWRNGLLAALGALSALLALALPASRAGLAGFLYFFIGAVEAWHGSRVGRLRRQHATAR